MRKHVVIPETDHAPAESLQVGSSTLVGFMAICVLSAVELDDEVTLDAREIREVRTNGMLTPEPETGETPIANPMPQAKLGVRHVLPQLACAITGPHSRMLNRTSATMDRTKG